MCNDSYIDDYIDALGHTYDDIFDTMCNNCDFVRNEEIHGDVNNDHRIDNKDLGLLMQYINGWTVEICIDHTDMNGDEKINNKDYALLMQFINGWNVELQ